MRKVLLAAILLGGFSAQAQRFELGIAGELSMMGRKEEGKKILDHVMKNISERSYHYDATAYYVAIGYYDVGAKKEGRELSMKLAKNAEDDINYILSLSDDAREALAMDVRRDLTIMSILSNTAKSAGDAETGTLLEQKLNALYQKAGQSMKLE